MILMVQGVPAQGMEFLGRVTGPFEQYAMIDTSVNRGTFLGIPSPAPKNFIVYFSLGHPVYIGDLRMDEFIDVF